MPPKISVAENNTAEYRRSEGHDQPSTSRGSNTEATARRPLSFALERFASGSVDDDAWSSRRSRHIGAALSNLTAQVADDTTEDPWRCLIVKASAAEGASDSEGKAQSRDSHGSLIASSQALTHAMRAELVPGSRNNTNNAHEDGPTDKGSHEEKKHNPVTNESEEDDDGESSSSSIKGSAMCSSTVEDEGQESEASSTPTD